MRDPITYRYPRTLDEAFGPDATSAHPFEGTGNELPAVDRPVVVSCAFCAAFMVLGSCLGWF